MLSSWTTIPSCKRSRDQTLPHAHGRQQGEDIPGLMELLLVKAMASERSMRDQDVSKNQKSSP